MTTPATYPIRRLASPPFRDPGAQARGTAIGTSNRSATAPLVELAERVAGAARPGEILVARTLRDLVVGSRIEKTERGPHRLTGDGEDWATFAVAAI